MSKEMTKEQARDTLRNAAWLGTNEDRERIEKAVELLCGEQCEDAISRESLKSKLKEHHDFFVNAYGGFSNLTLNDKSRVDEISNCIAMVVNEPPVQPIRQRGHWIDEGWYADGHDHHAYRCSECGQHIIEHPARLMDENPHCKYCGADMESEERA